MGIFRELYGECGVLEIYHSRGCGEWGVCGCVGYLSLDDGRPMYAKCLHFLECLCACATAGELDVGRGVHVLVVKCHAGDDVFVGTAIIDLYAKWGEVDAAVEVFNQMHVGNVVSWTAVIFDFVQEEDAIADLSLLKQMMEGKVDVNKFTLTSVLTACAKFLMINETHQIHCWMLKNGMFTDIVVKDALISTYAKISDVYMLEKIFEEIDDLKSPGAWSVVDQVEGLIACNIKLRAAYAYGLLLQSIVTAKLDCISSFCCGA